MRLLLTSAGITNTSIHDALVDLLGKPVSESNALCIPTASYGHPATTPAGAWQFISGHSGQPMTELGWKSLGVLELTALPSIDRERWVPWVRDTDALLVNGGDALYLAYWMRHSGLADLLPSLSDLVWVGFSAGSMVMGPRIGEFFAEWRPPTGDDSALSIVDLSIFPHLDHELCPENTIAAAERWAASMPGPSYAIDDDTAITVTDGAVDVVSEGHWRLFTPDPLNIENIPVLELGRPGPERDSGVQAILAGTKTAMTGLTAFHEPPLGLPPAVGDRFCVVDSNGQPAAIIELTSVDTQPMSAVDDDYAHAEGRGYPDAAQWSTAHEGFFRSEYVAQLLGRVPEINTNTLVITQRFRVIERSPAREA